MSSPLRAVVFGAAGLAIVGLLGLLAWALQNKAPVTGLSGITRVGQPAPDFTLPLFDDEPLVLSRLKGRPLVINFWASWCAPCRDEALGLERAWRSYKDREVVFIGVDIQDADEAARAHLSEFGVTYPNGRDADGKITVDYGIIGMPTTFFVSREGTVVRRWVGAIDDARLLSWVDELSAGAAPSGETDGVNPEGLFRIADPQ